MMEKKVLLRDGGKMKKKSLKGREKGNKIVVKRFV
jgi:hypothetical protein